MGGLNAIIAVLPKLPNLSSLKCAFSKVPFWPRSAVRATLGDVTHFTLTFLMHLTICSLNGNNIGLKIVGGNWVAAPEGVAALAEGIAKCQNLQILRNHQHL